MSSETSGSSTEEFPKPDVPLAVAIRQRQQQDHWLAWFASWERETGRCLELLRGIADGEQLRELERKVTDRMESVQNLAYKTYWALR